MKRLKVTVFVFFAAVCTMVSSAAVASSLTGFYAGAEGGASLWKFKWLSVETPGGPVENPERTNRKVFLGRVGAFVGCGKGFNTGIYIGGQLGGGIPFGSYKGREFGNYQLKCGPHYYYYGDLQFGYAVTYGCLLYFSGGLEGQSIRFELAEDSFGCTQCTTIGKGEQTFHGTVGLGVRYQFTNGVFIGVGIKAMFGGRTNWTARSKIVPAPIITEFKQRSFYDQNGNVDYALVQRIIEEIRKFQMDTSNLSVKNQKLMENGQPLGKREEKEHLKTLSKNVQKAADAILTLAKKEKSESVRSKMRFQNYAVMFSLGYRF